MSQSPNFRTIYLNLDQVIIAETHIPFAFTEEDILHYVLVEQAQLFPTLDQAIYFDFLIQEVEAESKKIVVVACNQKDISDLDSTVMFLKIRHEGFEALNLLPWRQRSKALLYKKQLKILVVVAISLSFFMLMIVFFYIHLAHQDKKRAVDLSHRKHAVLLKISALEKSNQEVQLLVDRWQGEIDNVQRQWDVQKMLKMIEGQRPEDIVLDKIVWKEDRWLIKGRSRGVSIVNRYLNNLSENKMKVQLNFIGNLVDSKFSVQFEIETRDEEK